MNRHFAPRNKSPTLRLLPPLGNVKWNFHFAAWVAWVLGYFYVFNLFQPCFPYFFAGRFWKSVTQEAQLDAMKSVPPHESTCSLHTHPGCDLARSGIPYVDSFTEVWELQMGLMSQLRTLGNQWGQWLFHVVSYEFQWNVTFPKTYAHDLAQGARWSKRSKRSQCARQIGGILTSSQLTFGLL